MLNLRSEIRTLCCALMATLIPLAGICTNDAKGVVTSGDAQAFGVSTGITLSVPLLPPVGLTIAPVPDAAGTAPPAFSDSSMVASASVTGGGSLLNLIDVQTGIGTGVLVVNASSDVDGLPGIRSASADATVDNTDISINSVLPLLNSIFSLNATLIQSTALVTGDIGALSALGTTTLAGVGGISNTQATLGILGTTIALDANPAANTLLSFDLSVLSAGAIEGLVSVILNEQIFAGDGINALSIDVNAIHISFTDVGLTGTELLNGDIIISHSDAALVAVESPSAAIVPEPTSMSLLVMSSIGLAWRRARQVA